MTLSHHLLVGLEESGGNPLSTRGPTTALASAPHDTEKIKLKGKNTVLWESSFDMLIDAVL